MTALFIRYQDVCKKVKEDESLKKLYSQKKFKEVFQLIFNFKDKKMVDILLNNWEKAIEDEIDACEDFVESEEKYQIKRINLKENYVAKTVNLPWIAATKPVLFPSTALVVN